MLEYTSISELCQAAQEQGVSLSQLVLADQAQQMEEFMFLGLRMNEGVTRAAFEQSFGVPIEAVYLETLRKLKEQGLLQMVAGRIALTDKGMDLANYVMAKFLL